MGLNFPTLPSVGTLYPQPAIPGVPVYRWDGEKWSLQSLVSKQPIYDDGSIPMSAQLKLVAPPVAANDATAKSYVDAGDTTAAAGKVRYDAAQALTSAQQEQARINVYAAPIDALAQFGMQVNGSCEIDQINNSVAQTANGYLQDCWTVARVGSWTCNWQRVSDAPPGYSSSARTTVTAGNGSPAPSDLMATYHIIEGTRIARLRWGTASAQPLSIAFWAKAKRPGTYGAAVRNAAADRAYPFTYSIAQADTWEFKTITVPGDTGGTWQSGAVAAMYVAFPTACGGNFVGTPNVWQSGNILSGSGAINGAQAATDVFQVTGLLLLPGIELPSALRAPFAQRFIDQELLSCQRYYAKTVGASVAQALAAGIVHSTSFCSFWWQFPVQMRQIPSVTGTGSGGLVAHVSATNYSVSSIAPAAGGPQSVRMDATMSGSPPQGQGAILECAIVGSGLFADARL